jgi:hypothetical protein
VLVLILPELPAILIPSLRNGASIIWKTTPAQVVAILTEDSINGLKLCIYQTPALIVIALILVFVPGQETEEEYVP